MISVALLSKWHVHAEDYAKQAEQNENLSIRKVWDIDERRGKAWAYNIGVPYEPQLQKVLEDPNIDAVIVNTPTTQHKEVILEAAKHRKHIFTEKVLALTVQDCKEIYSAVEDAGVKLVVSLPRLSDPSYLYAQKALDEGWVGTLKMIRCRLAHNGGVSSKGRTYGWLPERFFNKEESGGGALVDLGAHPLYLLNRLAGEVSTVFAQMQTLLNEQVDDNTIVLTEHESGALGIIETSFVSQGSPYHLELYGTGGTLLIENEAIQLKSPLFEENENFHEEIPSALPTPLHQWVMSIKGTGEPTITKDDVCRLTHVNELALLSHQEGRRVNKHEIGGTRPLF
ncbi:putative dehydrogenase [Geomicrobium halophilum]|uniref:Putative dehydrogenase n=1 Tax=Geomicrobium halophilum TaxID=549000 RepID=A0A841PWM1_9BACL|nr:Gfo/Idh/MocA family oxidoreductase [Geomicrobium halophilum]MBB6450881.1 putative dehydrogenase [Geomicrobium halophilum]